MFQKHERLEVIREMVISWWYNAKLKSGTQTSVWDVKRVFIFCFGWASCLLITFSVNAIFLEAVYKILLDLNIQLASLSTNCCTKRHNWKIKIYLCTIAMHKNFNNELRQAFALRLTLFLTWIVDSHSATSRPMVLYLSNLSCSSGPEGRLGAWISQQTCKCIQVN